MKTILTSSKARVIPQVKKLMEFDDIELEFNDEYIDDIAKLASKTKTGARGPKPSGKQFTQHYVQST